MDVRILVPESVALAIEGLGAVASKDFYGKVMDGLTDDVQGQYDAATPGWWSGGSKTLAFRRISDTYTQVGALRQVWFQEFGTKDSPKPILPKKLGGVLVWSAIGIDVLAGRAVSRGQMLFYGMVRHKGVPAQHWIGNAVKAAWEIFSQRKLPGIVFDAVKNGG